jgi:CPA1 family monovalent cation:H+ antiporter
MRGVVTLAAAFVIPEETRHREILLLIAFTVVAGTLFVQGLSLPWVARWLRVPAPDPRDDALARATLLQQASKAGLEELERQELDDEHGIRDLIRQRSDQRNFAAWERLGTVSERETPSEQYARARSAMIAAERARVLEIRSAGTVASSIVAEVLSLLDVEESMLDSAFRDRASLRNEYTTRSRLADACEDLASYPRVETVAEPVCASCVEEGFRWVALRQCLVCGHVGCCDSSPRQHASAHFRDSAHPVVESAEPGEEWRWCFVHHVTA